MQSVIDVAQRKDSHKWKQGEDAVSLVDDLVREFGAFLEHKMCVLTRLYYYAVKFNEVKETSWELQVIKATCLRKSFVSATNPM